MSIEKIVKTSPLRDAALAMAAAGVPVFPCLPGSKQPACANGFHDASTDIAQIEAWWSENEQYNIAIVPARANWFVVDQDTSFENDLQFPPTWTVKTPSGGFHYYYETNLVFGNRKITKGVDARSAHGYVLVAPSVTEKGTYTVVDAREPQPLPQFIVDRMVSRAERKTVDHDVELDRPAAIEKAVLYLQHAEPAVEGNGGDQHTFNMACKLVRDMGLDPDTAIELMQEWNSRCVPPWDDEELATKVHNAARYGQNDIGSTDATPNSDVQAFKDYGEGRKPGKLKIRRVGELRKRTPKPVQMLIPDWLEKGVTAFLAAPGKMHKSRLALQWGLSLQAGIEIFDKPVIEPCQFVMLSYEDDEDELTRRVHAMEHQLAIKDRADKGIILDLSSRSENEEFRNMPLLVVDEGGVHEQQVWAELIHAIREYAGDQHIVLVVDSCYNAVQFTGNAKVNETSVKRAISKLDELAAKFDLTTLLLWHPSSSGRQSGEMTGWSEAWTNAPRQKLGMSRTKDGNYALTMLAWNHGPAGHTLQLAYDGGVMVSKERSQAYVSLRQAAVETAELYENPAQRIKRGRGDKSLYSGKDKITDSHAIMDSLAKRCKGVRHSVEAFREALDAAVNLYLLSYVEGGSGRAAETDPAGYVKYRGSDEE